MESEKIFFEKVERYLNKELSAIELAEFELLRAKDADFDAKVLAHIVFLKQLNQFGTIKKLKYQMNQIHRKMDTVTLVDEVKTRRFIFKDFVQRNKFPISVAATIVLLLVFSALFYNSQYKQSGTYEIMMRREVAKIKRSQSSLVNKINSMEKGVSPKEEKYSGTGFVISSSGYLLTNYHVINGADSLYIQNEKGATYKVKTVFANPEYDLAILKVEDPSFKGFGPLPYSFQRKFSMLGERVYTLGYPKDEAVYGEGYLSANTGFNSDTTSYQISLSVNPGNSGGPLFNEQGDVVGIISGKQAQMDGFTFAVKSKYLFNTIQDLNTDTLRDKLILSNLTKKNAMAKLNRPEQIQKIKDFIYMVKVYN